MRFSPFNSGRAACETDKEGVLILGGRSIRVSQSRPQSALESHRLVSVVISCHIHFVKVLESLRNQMARRRLLKSFDYWLATCFNLRDRYQPG